APWTVPSTASILSGLHPLRHGSTRHGSALGAEVASLAEVLSAHGWRTHGLSHNHNVSRTAGFDQGFDRFEDFEGRSTAYPDVGEMVARATELLGERRDEPLFLYLQPMNVHGPYKVPEERADRVHGRPPAPGFVYY